MTANELISLLAGLFFGTIALLILTSCATGPEREYRLERIQASDGSTVHAVGLRIYPRVK